MRQQVLHTQRSVRSPTGGSGRKGIGWTNQRGEGADKRGGEGRASKWLTTETLVHIDMRGWTHDCTCVIDSVDSVCASHASTSAVGRLLGVGCIMDAIRSARPFDTPGSGGACPLRSRTNSSPCAANLLCEPSSAPRAIICISSFQCLVRSRREQGQ